MYSMCPNSKDVWNPDGCAIEDNIPLEPDLTYKCYPIKVLDQQDWATRKKTIWFIRFNGTIIRKMKQLVNARITFDLIFQTFYPRGKPALWPRIFIPYLESRGEISSKGGGM
jgi:hypothetical protein